MREDGNPKPEIVWRIFLKEQRCSTINFDDQHHWNGGRQQYSQLVRLTIARGHQDYAACSMSSTLRRSDEGSMVFQP